MKTPIDCAKNLSEYGRKFMNNDCLCDSNNQNCFAKSLYQKSVEFVCQFECFPALENVKGLLNLSWNDMIHIHRNLVDDYNNTLETFRSFEVEKLSKRALYFY